MSNFQLVWPTNDVSKALEASSPGAVVVHAWAPSGIGASTKYRAYIAGIDQEAGDLSTYFRSKELALAAVGADCPKTAPTAASVTPLAIPQPAEAPPAQIKPAAIDGSWRPPSLAQVKPAAIEPARDLDDGSDVVALIRAAGLKGYNTAELRQPHPVTDTDDGSDVVALARAFGIKGFVNAPASTQQPAKANPPGDPDGDDIVAMLQRFGVKGFAPS